ncbi:MAG: ArnT family glycosyltransferase [Nitrospinales bacterium]
MRFLKNRCLISILVFLFSFSLLFATLEDMGVTIDEPYVNRAAGISFVAWLGVAVEDIAKGDWGHFTSKKVIKEYFPPEYTYHPPFARFLTGITWKLFHESIGEIRALRLAPALLFSISVALLFLLVSGSYGVAPGLLASLSLALCPAPFGHAHLIALDSQIASMWLITAFCFIKGLHSRRWAVLFAVSAGLAMNTKIHGFAVPFPLFLWGVLFFRNKILPNALALLIISPLILFLTNPDYWNSPHHLFYFFDAMWTKGSYQKIATHFLGERYGFSPPKYYAFFMILISIPPLTLILALCGAALGSKQEIQNRLKAPPGRVGLSVFLSLNALAALGLTLLKNIPIYDGVRLFLPAFPFVSGLAGVGLFYLIRFLKQEKLKPVVSYGVLLATLSTSAYSLAKIHPFELSYFNLFIGACRGQRRPVWNLPTGIARLRLKWPR